MPVQFKILRWSLGVLLMLGLSLWCASRPLQAHVDVGDAVTFSCSDTESEAGSSPFDYTLRLTQDLSTAVDAYADGCVANEPNAPETVTLSPSVGFVGAHQFQATVKSLDVQLPLTFTWLVNDVVVRSGPVLTRTDWLSHTWGTVMMSQPLRVVVSGLGDVSVLRGRGLPCVYAPRAEKCGDGRH